MDDLISRKVAIKAIESLQDCYNGFSDTFDKACIIGVLDELPSAYPYSDAEIQKMQDLEQAQFDKVYQIGYEEGKKDAQPEPLIDTEQRIFLAAMSREEKVCKGFDEAWQEPCEKSLVRVCKEIERKVKKALWTN